MFSSGKEVKIHYIPPKVENEHIQSNRKLLTDTQINYIKENLKVDGRYSKKISKSPFTILVSANKYYAMYWGIRHYDETDGFGKALGAGTFGAVKLVQSLDTAEWFVTKVIKDLASSRQEIKILNIIDEFQNPKEKVRVLPLQTSSKDFLLRKRFIAKLAKGIDLFEVRKRYTFLNRQDYYDIAIMMIKAVQELHGIEILHRDIKLENFVYDPVAHQICLIDFGAAKLMNNKEIDEIEYVGTQHAWAPELTKHRVYSKETDVYALGVALAELFNMSFLFEKNNLNFLALEEISKYIGVIKDEEQKSEVIKLIKKLLHPIAAKRGVLSEALQAFVDLKKKLPDEDKQKQINLLDLEIYRKIALDKKLYTDFLQNLKKYPYIVLIEANRTVESSSNELLTYAKIRNNLTRSGAVVSDTLYYANEMVDLISYTTGRIIQENNYKPIFFWVDKNSQFIALQENGYKQNELFLTKIGIFSQKEELLSRDEKENCEQKNRNNI